MLLLDVALLCLVVAPRPSGDSTGPAEIDPRLFTTVSAGTAHTCAITSAGDLFCWGHNLFGQLGDGTDENRFTPTPVLPGILFTGVSAGPSHTCAVDTDGRVHCWGASQAGDLGAEAEDDCWIPCARWPVETKTSSRFKDVSAGSQFTCGLTRNNEIHCWGRNSKGQLGTESTDTCDPEFDDPFPCNWAPVEVSGGLSWKAVSAGPTHVCGLTQNGAIQCWGESTEGRLGDGVGSGAGGFRRSPAPVTGSYAFTEVGAGGARGCGASEAGPTYCWGSSGLGNGSDTGSMVPTQVATSERFSSIATGGSHSCGATPLGVLCCWGSNIYGEVGDSTHTRRTEPTEVFGDLTFTSLDAGRSSCHGQTCGIALDGTTYCWGRNYQRSLNGSTHVLVYAPLPVAGDPGFQSVEIGGNVVCGLRGSGELSCWGTGYYGQAGNGSTSATILPTSVRPGLRFSSVSSGQYHTCGVTVDGRAYCWGRNSSGRLGNPSNPLGWTVPVVVWSR